MEMFDAIFGGILSGLAPVFGPFLAIPTLVYTVVRSALFGGTTPPTGTGTGL